MHFDVNHSTRYISINKTKFKISKTLSKILMSHFQLQCNKILLVFDYADDVIAMYLICFSFKCNSVSSNDPRDEDSGYVCYETRRGQYTNYNMCCDLGPRGRLDGC
jgi:hypothetical protein